MLKKINSEMEKFGYKRKGNNFWKIEQDVYKVINFQKGSYGDYFFVNIGIHPIGMPQVLTDTVSIIENPKEYECVIRQRIEQIVDNNKIDMFKKGFISTEDDQIIESIIKVLPQIEKWSLKYATYTSLLNKSEKEMIDLFSVTPILKRKAFLLLQLICEIKLKHAENAYETFKNYKKEEIENLNFDKLNEYLNSLLSIMRGE